MLYHDPLEYWARAQPDAVFANDPRRTVTYDEMARGARRLAGRLVGHGVGRGDRVAVLADNSVELFLGYYATSMAGAAFVPVNPRLASPERRHVLEDSGAVVVLAVADLIQATDLPEPGPTVVTLRGAAPEWALDVDRWVDGGPSAPLPEVFGSDDVYQAYTSGTTGRPKGAVHTHASSFGQVDRWHLMGQTLGPGEAYCSVMSPTMAAGMALCTTAIYGGASLELADGFDPVDLVDALSDGRAHATALAPTMVRACLEVDGVEDRPFDGLKWIVYGAAPMSVPLLHRAIDVFGCDFWQGFGQTEAPNVTMLTPADHRQALAGRPELLATTGRIQPGVSVRITSPEGRDLPVGQSGEVLVKADSVMRCYWKDPERTDLVQRDGWHATGDAGWFDEDGYLHLADRLKDMVITGGFNVYPREVERVLEGRPEIAEVAVIGVPDDHWGEAVVAVVRPAEGTQVAEAQVVAWVRGELASYKVPKRVHFTEDLAHNANGKVQKHLLRARYGSPTSEEHRHVDPPTA